jgi:prepilin-type processing-associated H-X9-DG protein
LVELLVVITLIGVLAAMLLPALSRSQAAARRIRCTANLQQLGLAGQMYWDDHAGAAFRYRGVFTNGGDVYWFGWLARGAEGARRFDVTAGALHPYLGGRGVGTCPALNTAVAGFKLKATGAAFGYGYNLHLSAPESGPAINVHRLSGSDGLVFLADAAQVNTFQAPASPENPMLEEFYYVAAGEPTAHFRHAGVANAVFCDGHVAPERPLTNTVDSRLPRARVARLRAEILRVP